MLHIRARVALAVGLLIVGGAGAARAAIMGGQVDTFEDQLNPTLNWSNGASNPSPAANAAGGPGGAGDHYMSLASNGGGAGGRLVVFNSAQWAGDYLDAGVNAIQMQVNNQGNTNLTLRLLLVNFGNGQQLSTVAPVAVPAGSGWTTVSFSLDPGNLTGGTYATVMANVGELNLMHSPTAVLNRTSSPPIVAALGVDNITAVAVPEPNVVGLAVTGFAAAECFARRRRRRV